MYKYWINSKSNVCGVSKSATEADAERIFKEFFKDEDFGYVKAAHMEKYKRHIGYNVHGTGDSWHQDDKGERLFMVAQANVYFTLIETFEETVELLAKHV